jgi:hypothetical protein
LEGLMLKKIQILVCLKYKIYFISNHLDHLKNHTDSKLFTIKNQT